MSIQVASAVVQPPGHRSARGTRARGPHAAASTSIGKSTCLKVSGCQEEVRARVGRAHNGVALFVSRPRLLVGREAGGGGTEVSLKVKRRRTGIANPARKHRRHV
ncbi:hypothetical protein EVAR_51384_1 [Eumeta japonica]|uniref:Uncharacterized protein n=1 Tax=Eumeta variegata TaxID=151549 RepID=A0A4C1ZTB3_EUMVA|nr:hypothetical protein EVAR_51384_1 [Eumeta japonica]